MTMQGIPLNAVGSGTSGPPLSYASAALPARPGLDTNPSSQRAIILTPIADLSPYLNKWTIRARVTLKPPVRPWYKSKKKQGKVLNVNLADNSGEIKAIIWNEAAFKYASIFEVGKVYYISGGYLKPANKRYCGGIKNDYTLTFNDDTEVEVGDLPNSRYNRVNSFIESSLEEGTPATKRRKKQTTTGDTSMEAVELSLDNLNSLHCELHPVSERWYSLGVQLHVPVEVLKCIRTENPKVSECLLETLTTWLKCANPPHTWKAVADALESPPLAERTLAQQLRGKYCQGREETITHISPNSPPGAPPTPQGDPMEPQADDGEPTVVVSPTPTSHEQETFKTESMLLFEEAMKQGHIEVSIIKCLLFGPAGVGKSCLLRLLLDMLPPPLRQSTACIEQAIRAVCMKCGIDSEGEWQKVDSDRLCDLLAGSVSKQATSIRDCNDPPPANCASLPEDYEGATPHDHEGTSSHDHELDTAFARGVSLTMEAIIKRLEGKPAEELGKLQDMTWVYLVDSGGQPQFHELLTAFVRNASVGIFVHKLSERLDDHPHVQYFDRQGEQCGKGYPSPLSNRDILQHCVQTVQSLPYTTAESTRPQLAIVGTHRDEEHQCKGESREEKNEKLLEIVRPIRDNVFFCTGMQEVIFPVNAKSPEPEDKAIASHMRHTIESLKPPAEKLPLQWYGLELELEKEAVQKGRLVFTKDECLQVAKRLHFPRKEALDAALIYLDKLNIFLYYPSVLPELLFCSPCVLQDKISELVEESYRIKHDLDSRDFVPGELRKFCHLGQVTAQHLQKYPKHYTEFFTPAHLLKLFECLLIVAPINRDTYFMPSLLDVLKRSELDRPPCGCPLVIFFEDGCAPLGLFSSLVAFLLSDKNEPNSWLIAVDIRKLYRNYITFGLGDSYPGSVTLIDSATFFEVHLTIECEDLPLLYKGTCRYVSRTILTGLSEATNARSFRNVRYQEAIICPCKESRHTLHPALPSTTTAGTQIWRCTERPQACGKLNDCHLAWLNYHTGTGSDSLHTEERTPVAKHRKKETTTEDTPVETVELTSDNHIDITDYLLELEKNHIYHLGLVLGLSRSRVKGMMDSSTTFLDDVIAAWLRREDQVKYKGLPTWGNLMKALRHPRLKQNGVADKIAFARNVRIT